MLDSGLDGIDLVEDFFYNRIGHVQVGEWKRDLLPQGEPPGFLYDGRSRVQGMLTEWVTEPVVWQITV